MCFISQRHLKNYTFEKCCLWLITYCYKSNNHYCCWLCFSRYPENGIVEMDTSNLRPRARTILKWSELKVGDVVMVNYNVETPEERGFWFDAEITSLREISRTNKEVHAKILLG